MANERTWRRIAIDLQPQGQIRKDKIGTVSCDMGASIGPFGPAIAFVGMDLHMKSIPAQLMAKTLVWKQLRDRDLQS